MYLPSSVERKRAVMAYLLVGLLFFSTREELSVYEYHHFKQAIGRYTATMFVMLMWLFVFWIPLIKYIPGLLVLANMIWAGILVFSARKGTYTADPLKVPVYKRIYADIGGWILSIFDIKKSVYGDITGENSSFPPIGEL